METVFDKEAKALLHEATDMVTAFLKEHPAGDNSPLPVSPLFKEKFFRLVDKVNISLMEDKDNFYGYFLFQMTREIRFDISSPTAVNFQGASYVLHFNPVIFLTLTLQQMESTIKHEILHILSLHLLRAQELQGRYSTLAMNIAMDIVVNTYLDYLPPYATTVEWVNLNYSLNLLPFESFEYYAHNLETALALLETTDADTPDDSRVETSYDPAATHAIWQESSTLDEKNLREFTEKFIAASQKGTIPVHVENLLTALRSSRRELPWNLYLKRLMGIVPSKPKKTITRRSRRQPERLDLRGQLRSHIARIIVALDCSGSITDAEFNQALQEVLNIVKNYKHEITIVECDSEIRRIYTVKTMKDIKNRLKIRGSTRFSPVIEYANRQKINLLIYFTDGKGEDTLLSPPAGYKTLWILSGRGESLSLKESYGSVKKLSHLESADSGPDFQSAPRDGYSMNYQEKGSI